MKDLSREDRKETSRREERRGGLEDGKVLEDTVRRRGRGKG